VERNLIGTNAACTAAVPNGDGVEIESGAAQNTIGGTSLNARNVISGNINNGVLISGNGSFTEDNVVEGNLIGTNAAGRSALPNGANGVLVSGAAVYNTIGGASSAAGNVISGNKGDGVLFSDAGTSNNLLQYNKIGTDATGESPVSNANGVVISRSRERNRRVFDLSAGAESRADQLADSNRHAAPLVGNVCLRRRWCLVVAGEGFPGDLDTNPHSEHSGIHAAVEVCPGHARVRLEPAPMNARTRRRLLKHLEELKPGCDQTSRVLRYATLCRVSSQLSSTK
jgi:hypothetical protein